MIILVPAEEQCGYGGYRHPDHGIVDEMSDERRRYDVDSCSASRASTRTLGVKPSFDTEVDGGFGLKRRNPTTTLNRIGRGDDETQLYAEYLRNSSSRSSSHELAKSMKDSVIAGMHEQDMTPSRLRNKQSMAAVTIDSRKESLRNMNGSVKGNRNRDVVVETRDGMPLLSPRLPHLRVDDSYVHGGA